MIYVNDGLRIRRSDPMNIVIERRGWNRNKGQTTWIVDRYYGSLYSVLNGLYKEYLMQIPEGEDITLKECIARIEKAEQEIKEIIGKADLPVE